jgi:hypothetical protein
MTGRLSVKLSISEALVNYNEKLLIVIGYVDAPDIIPYTMPPDTKMCAPYIPDGLSCLRLGFNDRRSSICVA